MFLCKSRYRILIWIRIQKYKETSDSISWAFEFSNRRRCGRVRVGGFVMWSDKCERSIPCILKLRNGWYIRTALPFLWVCYVTLNKYRWQRSEIIFTIYFVSFKGCTNFGWWIFFLFLICFQLLLKICWKKIANYDFSRKKTYKNKFFSGNKGVKL